MAVRIYALAKELNYDSKDLADICAKAGIPGKGSALSSLTEEEVAKLKQYLAGGGSRSKSTAAPSPSPERPKEPARRGKMPVLVKPKSSSAASSSTGAARQEEQEALAESPQVAASTAEAEQPAEESPAPTQAAEAASAAPAEAPSQPTPVRREDYLAPGLDAGKVPNLERRPKTAAPKKPAEAGSGGRSRPAVKLAPMPTPSAKPKPATSANEPPAQKPDMKLPAELIGMGKAGSKPLAAHLRRHERDLEDQKQRSKRTREPEKTEAKPKARGRTQRGKAEDDKEDRPMLGGREQRQLQRRRSPRRGEGDDSGSSRPSRRLRRSGTNTAAPRKDRITIQLPCTARELSEAAGVPAMQIIRILMEAGTNGLANISINSSLDEELAEIVAEELGIDVDFKQTVSFEDRVLTEIREREEDPADLVSRPPVITFLGHVDHGKTSLLDRIIGIDVVSGESGGITQHIRAYSIEKDGRRISFVDTPGHEAFTEMRARGANVTDIAVLVVAADDGVMPQTEEAISHARAAEVPIIVALNKTDLPGVDVNRALQGLSANDLLPSEWGGDVEVIKTSATTGEGIDELLETILTVAELHEYKANPKRPAIGTCLEAQQESGRGVVAKLLVKSGTLVPGDVVVCGHAYGRVKAMYDTLDQNVRHATAGPTIPVNVVGLDVAPAAGERFYVLDDIVQAREIAEAREQQDRTASLSTTGFRHVTLENLFDRLEATEEVQTLNLILRADTRGSIEAILKEFGKLEHPEVKIKVLQKAVGGITEADVTLADASDAVIIGFNVVPEDGARHLADERGVQLRRYEVIYKITEDLKAALEGMLKPEEREADLGRALVQQVFKIGRIGTVAGCRVLSGAVERNGRARIIRDSTIVGDYAIDTLRRNKDDAKEVREGYECGIKLTGFNDIKEGDVLEVYKIEEIGRTFDS